MAQPGKQIHPSATLESLNLHILWNYVRQHTIPTLVDDKLCPIPYIGNAHHFDMFNVFTKMPKKMTDVLKSRVLTVKEKYVCIQRLEDVLKIPPTPRKKHRTFADIGTIVLNPFRQMDPHFQVNLKIREGKHLKRIHFQVTEAKVYKGYVDTTVEGFGPGSKFYIDLKYLKMKVPKSVLVIDELCVAQKISFTVFDKTSDSKNWEITGPIPVAFRVLKYKLDPDGSIIDTKEVPVEAVINVDLWSYPEKNIPDICCSNLLDYIKRGIVVKRDQADVEKKSPEDGGFLRQKSVLEEPLEDFNNLSLTQVWSFLREKTLSEMLGVNYCPVPYFEDAFFYDLYNVFVVEKELQEESGAQTMRINYSYLDKLENLLACSNESCKSKIKILSLIYSKIRSKPFTAKIVEEVTKFAINQVSTAVHEINVEIDSIEEVYSNIDFTDGSAQQAFFNRYHTGLKDANIVFVITKVCIAKHISIRSTCKSSHSKPAEWNFRGLIPVGFQGIQLTLQNDGQILQQDNAKISELYPQGYWLLSPDQRPRYCSALHASARGDIYDLTRNMDTAPTYPVAVHTYENLEALT